jgi:dTDP-4-dehydrorhamnose reductase
MKNKKIVITGANGMLGSALVRHYREHYEVYAFHRDRYSLERGAEDFSVDLLDDKEVQRVIGNIQPHIVIHCVGVANIDYCEKNKKQAYDVNVTSTANIINACGTDTIVVYISTDQIYGSAVHRYDELGEFQPLNYYGETKYFGERLVVEGCRQHVIIRTNLFGWNRKLDRSSFGEWVYFCLKEHRSLILFDDYLFTPIYSMNLAEAIEKILENGTFGIFNIGAVNTCSKYEFGMYMAKATGFSSKNVQKGTIFSNSLHATRHNDLTLNVEKAKRMEIPVPTYQESINRFINDKS